MFTICNSSNLAFRQNDVMFCRNFGLVSKSGTVTPLIEHSSAPVVLHSQSEDAVWTPTTRHCPSSSLMTSLHACPRSDTRTRGHADTIPPQPRLHGDPRRIPRQKRDANALWRPVLRRQPAPATRFTIPLSPHAHSTIHIDIASKPDSGIRGVFVSMRIARLYLLPPQPVNLLISLHTRRLYWVRRCESRPVTTNSETLTSDGHHHRTTAGLVDRASWALHCKLQSQCTTIPPAAVVAVSWDRYAVCPQRRCQTVTVSIQH